MKVFVLRATPYGNLLLNSGNGALSFTLAMGNGRILANPVVGREPAVPL